MAKPGNFIEEFRRKIGIMNAAYNETAALAAFAGLAGFTEADFDTYLTGINSEITGADVVAAITSVGGLGATFAGEAAVLAKMLP